MARYTENQLRDAVAASASVSEVMRRLGYPVISGGNHTYLSKRIKALGVDTSHMKGQGWNRGNTAGNKLSFKNVLVYDRNNGRREEIKRLRRALLESGISLRCTLCGLGNTWSDLKIVLEIDHINGNPVDNRKNNLRFLCPNCHSQVTAGVAQ